MENAKIFWSFPLKPFIGKKVLRFTKMSSNGGFAAEAPLALKKFSTLRKKLKIFYEMKIFPVKMQLAGVQKYQRFFSVLLKCLLNLEKFLIFY